MLIQVETRKRDIRMNEPGDPGYVLVVDDDPDVRYLVCDVLETLKLPYRTATNGQEGIEQIRAETPSLIVLDLMMPVMDGLTMITRLRREAAHRDIPVILLSAIADSQPMGNLPGVIGVLRKGNLSLKELAAMISKALGVDNLAAF